MFQNIYIHNPAVQFVDPLAFNGILVRVLWIESSELMQMPNITDVKNSLERLILQCGKNCSLSMDFNYFHAFPKIKVIQVTRAGIYGVIWMRAVKKTVENIFLGSNRITTLATIHGVIFERLRYFDLSDNHISMIEPTFLFMPKLTVLQLNGNQLSYLNLSQCRFSSEHWVTIIADNNPWNCEGNWTWLYESLYRAGSTVKSQVACGISTLTLWNIMGMNCWFPVAERGNGVVPRQILEMLKERSYDNGKYHTDSQM